MWMRQYFTKVGLTGKRDEIELMFFFISLDSIGNTLEITTDYIGHGLRLIEDYPGTPLGVRGDIQEGNNQMLSALSIIATYDLT